MDIGIDIAAIVNRGGDLLNRKNREISKWLDMQHFSDEADCMIATTGCDNLYEAFAGRTVEEIEQMAREMYESEG